MSNVTDHAIVICTCCNNSPENCTCHLFDARVLDATMDNVIWVLAQKDYDVDYYAITNTEINITFSYLYKFPDLPPFCDVVSEWNNDKYGFYLRRCCLVFKNNLGCTSKHNMQAYDCLESLLRWAIDLPECDENYIENYYLLPRKLKESGSEVMLLRLQNIDSGIPLKKYKHPTKEITWKYVRVPEKRYPVPQCCGAKVKLAQSMFQNILSIHDMTSEERSSFAKDLLEAQVVGGYLDWCSNEVDDGLWIEPLDEYINNIDVPTWLASGFLMKYILNYPDEALQIPYILEDLSDCLTACYQHEFIGSCDGRIDGLLLANYIFMVAEAPKFLCKYNDIEPCFKLLIDAIFSIVAAADTDANSGKALVQNLIDSLDSKNIREFTKTALQRIQH